MLNENSCLHYLLPPPRVDAPYSFWYQKKIEPPMTRTSVAKVLWTLCYASPEEIPELQHPRRATGNRRNLQCGDDSIMRAKATRDKGSPCLGAVGASVWGVGLAGCRFLCAGRPLSILLCSLSMSGAALSTRLMGALRYRGSCS